MHGQNYWFPHKKASRDWDLPKVWQGWASMAAWLVILLADMTWLLSYGSDGRGGLSILEVSVFVVIAVLDVLGLALICLKRGAPLR